MGRRRADSLTRGERNIQWIEQYCFVPEGRDGGKPMVLREWQRDIIHGIYDTPTRRAIVSFGHKNGKTALSAMILLLHLADRTNHRLAHAMSALGQGLGMPEPHKPHLSALGLYSPHAPKAMSRRQMIPDRLLDC
jgi:hypothetical protein